LLFGTCALVGPFYAVFNYSQGLSRMVSPLTDEEQPDGQIATYAIERFANFSREAVGKRGGAPFFHAVGFHKPHLSVVHVSSVGPTARSGLNGTLAQIWMARSDLNGTLARIRMARSDLNGTDCQKTRLFDFARLLQVIAFHPSYSENEPDELLRVDWFQNRPPGADLRTSSPTLFLNQCTASLARFTLGGQLWGAL
jgi:hypothetical protein